MRVCVASCLHGPIRVGWSIQNVGPLDQEAGVEVVLFSVGADDTRTERQRVTLPAIPAGTQLEGMEFEVSLEDWDRGVAIQVDVAEDSDVGVVRECDESNNEVVWLESYCD